MLVKVVKQKARDIIKLNLQSFAPLKNFDMIVFVLKFQKVVHYFCALLLYMTVW